MELDAAHVERPVLQGHNLTFVALGGDFEAVGEAVLRHHPRVIAADGDVAIDAAEDGVVANDVAGRCHPVEHVAQVLEFASEGLAYASPVDTTLSVISPSQLSVALYPGS